MNYRNMYVMTIEEIQTCPSLTQSILYYFRCLEAPALLVWAGKMQSFLNRSQLGPLDITWEYESIVIPLEKNVMFC